jgi:hypothetical protein
MWIYLGFGGEAICSRPVGVHAINAQRQNTRAFPVAASLRRQRPPYQQAIRTPGTNKKPVRRTFARALKKVGEVGDYARLRLRQAP